MNELQNAQIEQYHNSLQFDDSHEGDSELDGELLYESEGEWDDHDDDMVEEDEIEQDDDMELQEEEDMELQEEEEHVDML